MRATEEEEGAIIRNQPRFPTEEYAMNLCMLVWLAAISMPQDAPRIASGRIKGRVLGRRADENKNTGTSFCHVERVKHISHEFRAEKIVINQ